MSAALLEAILRAPGAPWRALDRHVARWLATHSGEPLVALAGLAAAAAEAAGSACVQLPALATLPVAGDGTPTWPDWPRWQAALIASDWVDAGSGDSTRPLVLRAGDCYLRRNYDHETRLIAAIHARLRAPPTINAEDLRADLDALFGPPTAAVVDGQRLAAAAALGRGLFVLTGGPGTGKTSTVLRLLLLWLRQRGAGGGRIALTAPTGKAAQRLGETLAQGLGPLRARLPALPWAPLLDAIAALRPQTLHALLGARPDLDAFSAGPDAPLAADLLVVDEASMVDLALMRRTLEALRAGADLVLLGDAGQLASVEAGSVLADLVAAADDGNDVPATNAERSPPAPGAAPPTARTGAAPLAGHVLRLHTVWRASGVLLELAAAIRAGDAARLKALGADPAHARILRTATVADTAALARALHDAIDPAHGAGLFDDLLQAVSPAAALTALRGARVLTALRLGAFGQRTINRLIEGLLRRRFGLDADDPWYAGRPLLITAGERSLGLVNGDLGVVHADGDGRPRAWFEGAAGQEPRTLAPLALPAHETAYAMTVHKSQGSEFEHVVLILPAQPGRGLSRELLYTGATRARRRLELWAGAEVLEATLATRMQRASRLAERLRTNTGEDADR